MRRADRNRGAGAGQGSGRGRRLLQALLSTLVPGAGQMAGGASARGTILLAVVGVLLVLVLVVATVGRDLVLPWVVRPGVLVALLLVNVLLLGFRLYAVIDAYLTGRSRVRSVPAGLGCDAHTSGSSGAATPNAQLAATAPSGPAAPSGSSAGRRLRPTTVAVGVALTVLVLVTLAPHVVAGYYAYLTRDLILTVFVDERHSAAT